MFICHVLVLPSLFFTCLHGFQTVLNQNIECIDFELLVLCQRLYIHVHVYCMWFRIYSINWAWPKTGVFKAAIKHADVVFYHSCNNLWTVFASIPAPPQPRFLCGVANANYMQVIFGHFWWLLVPFHDDLSWLFMIYHDTYMMDTSPSNWEGLRRIVRPSAHFGGKSWQIVGTGNF